MLDREPPAWRTDAKWVCGILLAVAVAALVPLFSLSQLSARERAVPLLEQVLSLTLLPPGGDAQVSGVRRDVGYLAGEQLELMPGTGVFAQPGEIEGLSASEATDRIAASLASQTLEEGAPAVLERLSGSELAEQFEASFAGPAHDLVTSTLVLEMLPAGLENGSRMANWPLQAAQNPGEPVQPIVGMFVTVPPAELQGLNPRSIGVLVVEGLADVVLEQGGDAARELVTNINLSARLDDALNTGIPQRLQDLFETMLIPRQAQVADRLEQARDVLTAEEEGTEPTTLGVVTGEELAGLDPAEANALVLERLAERAHRSGSSGLVEVVAAGDQAQRLASVAGLVDSLSSQAHARYLRLSWIFGIAAVVLALLLILASRGWGRLANPGIALGLAAAVGAVLSVRLADIASAVANTEAPASLSGLGTFGYLGQLVAFVTASLPQSAFDLLVRNHLLVLVAGAALVVLALVLRLLGMMRPRRRSLL